MQNDLYTTAVPFVFAVGIAVPGVLGLVTTELPSPELSVLSGAYQRAYEDGFTDGFPMTNRSQELFTAVNLAFFGQTSPDVVIGDAEWLFIGEEFQQPTDGKDFLDALRTAQAALADHEISLIPVIVPDKARVYADMLPRDRGEALSARYNETLTQMQSSGFAPIDLSQVFLKGRANGEMFMRTDTHWSPLGAALAAVHVADVTGLAAAGSMRFETDVTPELHFEGDLMTFVDTGPLSAWIGITPERIDQPVTTAAEGASLDLFGDAEIGIVLVGTSFSARTEFNFAGALKAATHMDVVNLAVEGQGPFAPITEALSSGTIFDISPQYVVWEIPERYIQTWSFK